MEKPRVLLVAGSAKYGSGECLLLDYLLSPKEKFLSPIVVFPDEGPLLEKAREAGLETLVIPGKDYLTDFHQLWKQPIAWVYNLRSFVRMSRVIRTRKVHLVISLSFINWTGALSARQEGIPHIWMIREVLSKRHSRLNFFWGKWLASQLANDLSVRVLLESSLAAEMFSRKRTREKAEVLPPAIDAERFLSRLNESLAGSPEPESGIALFINDLNLKKIEKIINAVSEAIENQARKSTSSSKLFLFFPGLEEKKVERLKNWLGHQGLGDKSGLEFSDLEFSDFYSWTSLRKRFSAAIIIPGFDPLSRLVLEAGLSMVPVFVEEGPASELLINGETGFVIKGEDYQGLAGNLVKVLKNKDYRQSIGAAARQHLIQNYSLEAWKTRFEKIIEKSLSLP
ncbi:MAG: glycosyltransferase family 4 protein [Candidatus Aminicenantes bacterium]|nr:glycosyltransferase family 4 protein [Candidatus Aminicenantes bacterium]